MLSLRLNRYRHHGRRGKHAVTPPSFLTARAMASRPALIPLMLLAFFCAAPLPSPAKTDLVTLPARENVQLTIYNSADLTLVREQRLLTLRSGLNRLQFSWAGTLIDPTSLELTPKEHGDKIEVVSLAYPPRVAQAGVWSVNSRAACKVPVEITYLTSGLSWRAFYLGLISEDECSMRLEAYVRVNNNSGEDYENASTRLIVGTIHILDEIAALARRHYPYGTPLPLLPDSVRVDGDMRLEDKVRRQTAKSQVVLAAAGAMAPKEIVKEGLSEYFLYTIEGTETIPHGWGKRLPSFSADNIAITNLYKYEEEKYGRQVTRFISFINDKANHLGETPIPDGQMRFFRLIDKAGALSYEGRSEFKYIPVNKEAELNLGPVDNVVVEITLMDFKSDNYIFDVHKNICGWDEIREFKVEVKNTRPLPVRVEIKRRLPVPSWEMTRGGDCGNFEKIDLQTVKFTLSLPAASKKEFRYIATTRHGTRAER
ncbi:MAG: DUF4139 domain-containing protein [Kiritimatiellae bacterium]|jgi:hypothetical protein|nr:DUF4139 domain-containing protein [Kiritimatiellia bacterium]